MAECNMVGIGEQERYSVGETEGLTLGSFGLKLVGWGLMVQFLVSTGSRWSARFLFSSGMELSSPRLGAHPVYWLAQGADFVQVLLAVFLMWGVVLFAKPKGKVPFWLRMGTMASVVGWAFLVVGDVLVRALLLHGAASTYSTAWLGSMGIWMAWISGFRYVLLFSSLVGLLKLIRLRFPSQSGGISVWLWGGLGVFWICYAGVACLESSLSFPERMEKMSVWLELAFTAFFGAWVFFLFRFLGRTACLMDASLLQAKYFSWKRVVASGLRLYRQALTSQIVILLGGGVLTFLVALYDKKQVAYLLTLFVGLLSLVAGGWLFVGLGWIQMAGEESKAKTNMRVVLILAVLASLVASVWFAGLVSNFWSASDVVADEAGWFSNLHVAVLFLNLATWISLIFGFFRLGRFLEDESCLSDARHLLWVAMALGIWFLGVRFFLFKFDLAAGIGLGMEMGLLAGAIWFVSAYLGLIRSLELALNRADQHLIPVQTSFNF